MKITVVKKIKEALNNAVKIASKCDKGEVAQYIPELSSQDPSQTSIVVRLNNGKVISSGNCQHTRFTLQSVSKLVVLIGLLEEFGPSKVFEWVLVEPSGDDFSSVARLDQFGPRPSNPMLNSGAITLCSHIPGNSEEKIHWIEEWLHKLFNDKPHLNAKVFASERRTGDRNRALAYLLKSNDIIQGNIELILETYFALCSFEVNPEDGSYLPFLLANGGKNPSGEQIISLATATQAVSIMATCGLYNESGAHLVKTGMPAKSSVSGYLFAVVPGVGGVATFSPKVNRKGTSVRGAIMLEEISKELNWHFAI